MKMIVCFSERRKKKRNEDGNIKRLIQESNSYSILQFILNKKRRDF